jgi:hypothetical protein
MKRLSYALLLAAAIGLALAPTSAFANSDNPKCDPDGPFVCSSTGKHGGSENTCTPGSPGCNTTETTKHNPGGGNNTDTCNSPNPNVC